MVLQQGFTKDYERRGGGEVGLRQERERRSPMAAPNPPLYIGGGEGGAPPLGFPPLGAAALDGMEGAAKRGREGGVP